MPRVVRTAVSIDRIVMAPPPSTWYLRYGEFQRRAIDDFHPLRGPGARARGRKPDRSDRHGKADGRDAARIRRPHEGEGLGRSVAADPPGGPDRHRSPEAVSPRRH